MNESKHNSSETFLLKVGFLITFVYGLLTALFGFIIIYDSENHDLRATMKEVVRLTSIGMGNMMTKKLLKNSRYSLKSED